MEQVFINLLNMSITASWLVLAIVIFRFVFKKAPKAIVVMLWALVGLRLIWPFSLESVLSLVPSAETIPQDIIYTDTPTIHTGINVLNYTVNPIISETFAPNVENSVNPMQVIMYVASCIWLLGSFAMVVYTFISYWSIHRKVRESVRVRNNVWMCDRIDSPFIMGVFRPQIYLPSNMEEQDVTYVLAHENAHIKRRDHWWKPIGFALLTIYWFNPILWVAYVLLCRDIELACDEKVIKDLGEDMKKPYSDALINCSVPRKAIAACPLAFGEVGVKERIKSVLNYKKPAFWVIAIAVVVSVFIVVCFMTNPKEGTINQGKITVWYDYCPWSQSYEGNRDSNQIIETEIPGMSWVKFRDEIDKMYVETPLGEKNILEAIDVFSHCLNVFFCDLTEDGVPEFCATVSAGSGWIDERILVYDYMADKTYQLEDRWNYSYVLSVIDDELIVSKMNVQDLDTVLEQGPLYLKKRKETGELQLSFKSETIIYNNGEHTLASGVYLAGIKPEDWDPTSGDLSGQYFALDTDAQTFRMGGSIAMSFALFGTYEFDGMKLTLTTDAENPAVYVFYLNEKGGFVYNESESDVTEHNWLKDGLVFGLMPTD